MSSVTAPLPLPVQPAAPLPPLPAAEAVPVGPLVTRDKYVIAVDLDEVLTTTVAAFAVWHNEMYHTKYTTKDFVSYHFVDVLGGTEEEVMNKVHAFFESPFFASLAPIENAASILRSLTPFFNFVVVTARQHFLEERTRAWLNTHFQGVFSDVVFGNHYGASGVKRSKAEMCRDVGAIALIDDSLAYAIQCAQVLPTVILFGEYAWNTPSSFKSPKSPDAPKETYLSSDEAAAPLPSNIVRAINWAHVAALLLRLRPKRDTGHGGNSYHSAPVAPGSLRSPPAGGGASQRVPSLAARDCITINSSAALAAVERSVAHAHRAEAGAAGGMQAQPPASALHVSDLTNYYVEMMKRAFEISAALSITGTGHDTRLVAEVAATLERVGVASVTSLHTGADAAPPHRPRFPRLTILMTRDAGFLEKRFKDWRVRRTGMDDTLSPSSTARVSTAVMQSWTADAGAAARAEAGAAARAAPPSEAQPSAPVNASHAETVLAPAPTAHRTRDGAPGPRVPAPEAERA